MPSQKQRREAARRHLERQVQRRAQREASRKKFTLIASVVGTLAVIGLVIGLVVGLGGSDKGTPTAASPTATDTAAADCPAGNDPQPKATGTTDLVSFNGVTVSGATDFAKNPSVGSTATTPPTSLEVKDLIVGTGKAANPTSSVKVQYTGVLYCDGSPFDTPSTHGNDPIPFSLTGVVAGFTQGIGGGSGTTPMKVGGRRIIIMPASMAYGDSPPSADIPPNSPLVFVVDLKSVS